MYEKKETIILNIETVEDQPEKLSISLSDHGKPIRPKGNHHEFSRLRVEEFCKNMIKYLNSSNQRGETPEDNEKLKNNGRILCDELLPAKIKKDLTKSKAHYLELHITSDLVHMLWELLVIDDTFLSMRFRMGRFVQTRQSNIIISDSRKPTSPLQIMILADPKDNLPDAAKEGQELFDLFSMHQKSKTAVKTQLYPQITKDQLSEKIRIFDIIHFAGHTDNSSDNSIQKGWLLSKDTINAEDIKKMAGGAPLPALVFSNSCQSVGSSSWETKQHAFDLAGAFMLAGACHYIGTFWDVLDLPSSYFALYFYEHLLKGESIGDSIHFARSKLIEQGEGNCWTSISYLLYGDPAVAYFTTKKEDGEQDDNHEDKENQQEGLEGKKEQNDDSKTEEKQDEDHLNGEEQEEDQQDKLEDGKNFFPKEKLSKRSEDNNYSKSLTIHKNHLLGLILCIILLSSVIIYFFINKDDTDTWTSSSMTLSVKYDISITMAGKNDEADKIIRHYAVKHSISKALKEYGRFIIVERGKGFEEIEKEINRWEDLPMNKRYCIEPKILPVDIFVFFKLYNDEILLTICQSHTTECNEFEVGQIHSGNIFQQRHEMAKKLISNLDSLHPIRGRIVSISEQGICLNIGHNVGVRRNQTFEVIDYPTIVLSVHTVTEKDSICHSNETDQIIQPGWKVELRNSRKISSLF